MLYLCFVLEMNNKNYGEKSRKCTFFFVKKVHCEVNIVFIKFESNYVVCKVRVLLVMWILVNVSVELIS